MHYRIALICLLGILLFGSLFTAPRHRVAHSERRPDVASIALAPPRRVALPTAVIPGKPPAPIERQTTPRSDQEYAAAQARKLTAAMREGRMTLTVAGREGEQFEKIGRDGAYRWPPPPKKIVPAPVIELVFPPLLSAALPNLPGFDMGSSDALAPAQERPTEPLSSRKGGAGRRPASDADVSLSTGPEDAVAPPAPCVPSRVLMRMLTVLAAHSTPRAPLEVMTLLRPPYRSPEHPRGTPTNTHSLGLAADVAAYAGFRIGLDRPEDCVRMTLALLRDMPPGDYRLGLPKAPAEPLVVGQPPTTLSPHMWLSPDAASPETALAPNGIPNWATIPAVGGWLSACMETSTWPFFPAPEPALESGLIAPMRLNGKIVRDAGGHPVARIVRYRNSEYAPEEEIGDERVRKALADARGRGVNIRRVFPDAGDHIHVDVKLPSAPVEAEAR